VDARDVLERVEFYRHAPAELRSVILRAARHTELAPGDWLFREGDSVHHLAAVGAGSIRVFRTGATGRQITLYHARGGESSLVGILSVLLGTPAIATAQAEVAAEVVMLPATSLREWVGASDAMRRFIFETMRRALIDLTSLLEDVAFRTIDSRLAAMLLDHLDDDHVVRMRHDDIAAELGTAREVVSRTLDRFERHGAVVRSRGRIELRDEDILQQLA
jgi:CRP/FNR family transcriptional regulator, anaerobic regulatory protein